MAELKYLANINLNTNQLLNVSLQQLSSDPSGFEGQIYYDTTNNALKFHNGSGFVAVGTSNATGDITAVTAGNGLTGGGSSGDVTLAVGVDDSSIEINSDALRVKASGITNAMLGGSIAASKLAGSIGDSKLSTISTANKVALSALDIDGGTDIGAALVDADLFIVDDGANGTERKATMSRLKTYMQNGLTFTTNTNTVDMGDGFVIEDADGTEVTITENKEIKFTGTGGLTINFTDTSTGSDGDPFDLQFAIGTLNQNTTGSAATLTTARNIGGVSFDGSAAIDLPGVNSGGNQDTSGNAATATKIASITNSDIVQLTASQTLTNKTIAASQVTEISNITAAEGAQLENIGTTTISATQWGYLGASSGAITNTNTGADMSQATLKTKIGGAFGSNALAVGDSNATVTVPGDFVVDGSITLKGDTVLESTTNTAIKDKILLLNQGATGNNSNDLAVMWERGDEANVALKWDEGDGEFHFICTSATGSEANGAIEPAGEGNTAGSAGFQNLKIGKVTLTSIVLDGNTITGVDDSGEFTNDDAHIMTSAGVEDKILGYSYITASSSNTLTNKTIAISQVTELSNLTATEGAQLENIGSTTISATQWGYLGAATGAITNTDTVDMGSGFVIEDGDGTEVTITENKEIKFVEGGNIDINFTDTSTGSDGDPFDLSFSVPDASASTKGAVELATTAEALTGTDTARAVTAAGLAARSHTATIGDGSDQDIAITHNLGTRAVNVQLFDASSYETVIAEVVRTDANTVTINTNAGSSIIGSSDVTVVITKIQ